MATKTVYDTNSVTAPVKTEEKLTLTKVLSLTKAKLAELSGDDVAKLRKLCAVVAKVSKEVENETKERLEAGQQVGNLELVPTRPSRVWKDEEAVMKAYEDILGDDMFAASLLSPAQLEKELKKHDQTLDPNLVEKKSSGKKIQEAEDLSGLL